MVLHPFTEYLKYKWKSKGRHGVHSPFVYDLVAHVLRDKGIIEQLYIIKYPSLPLHYENLISRIAAYYEYKVVVSLPVAKKVGDHADILLFNEAAPLQWVGLMDEYYYLLKNESVIVIPHIHKTAEHTMGWSRLCADDRVRLSIDVYGIGLLFFKREFKEQQHFILKY